MGSYDMLDRRLWWDLELAKELLDKLGPEGRLSYSGMYQWDLWFFPLSHAAFLWCAYYLCFTHTLQVRQLALSLLIVSIPGIAFLADYVENLAVLALLNSFPMIDDATLFQKLPAASIGGTATAIKWAFAILSWSVLIVGLNISIAACLWEYISHRTSRKKEKAE
eukprot:CAMPEP_0184481970 /NCGR_PEP_ID=MMETSP0113_2-20130426/3567_1 /TAXON_ID=91329 /ORGANISM="Norrisiella sphaerica, Strain BC52" /LENGTH=164 /DNA_ID=CAMNT_0026861469 /DNA_START=291 /DNA_END=785 /DNA_ORIENTATION=-